MEELYKEYSKIVYNYLLYFTNNPDIAEELMQETFYSAVKNLNKFKKEAGIKTWLCKIAKNKWIDYYKKTKKLNEVNIDNINEEYLSINSIEEGFFKREEILDIYKKIHNLDEQSKEVVYLRIKGAFSFKEIAYIMGKTDNWARITFYRAKLKLMEDLKDG